METSSHVGSDMLYQIVANWLSEKVSKFGSVCFNIRKVINVQRRRKKAYRHTLCLLASLAEPFGGALFLFHPLFLQTRHGCTHAKYQISHLNFFLSQAFVFLGE